MPSIYNAAAVPPLTVIEGSTNTEIVATFDSSDPVGDLSAYVNWLGGSATAYSPPEIYALGAEFVPGIGNVPEYAVVSTFTAGPSTGANQPLFSVEIVDSAAGVDPTFVFGTIQVLEAPLTLRCRGTPYLRARRVYGARHLPARRLYRQLPGRHDQ